MPTSKLAKSRRAAAPKPQVELPERIHVTDGELAVFTRLARVMRQTDERGAYWLGPFIEWLLYLDITDPDLNYASTPAVLAALKDMGMDDGQLLQNGSRFVKAAMRQCPGITFISPVSATPKTETKAPIDAYPQSEDDQFYQLLRQWRLEYPEPKKPQQPTGHLGRGDESGD
jgi:hypothetical protein